MADINTYALGLEFQLQMQPAMESINKMIAAASDLTAALSKAGKALDVGQQVYDWEEVQKVVQAYELKTLSATTASIRLNKALAEGSNAVFMSADAEKAYNKKIEELRNELTLAKKEAKDFYKENKQYADFLNKQKKTHDERMLQFKREDKALKENAETVKNQIQPLKDFGNWLAALTDDTKVFGQALTSFVGKYGLIGGVLSFLAVGFKDVMDLQEAYRLASMRLIGTQNDLIQSSLSLSQTLGASSKEAIDTITALAAVGYSAVDAINELAEANFKFQRITGVTAGTIARYQRTLSMMGLDAKQSTRALAEMSAIMRNTGLTATQLDGLMKDLSKTMVELRLSFDPKSVAQFGSELAKVTGAAHAAGVEGSALQKFLTDMASDVFENAQAWATFGVAISQNMDIAAASQKAIANMGPVVRELSKQHGILTQTILEGRGIPKAAAAEILAIVNAAEAAGVEYEDYINSTHKAIDMEADFKEATATLTQQLKLLLVPIMKVASVIASALIPAVTTLFSWINAAIDSVRTWWAELEKGHPTLVAVISSIAKGGAIAAIVTIAVVKLAGSFMSLGKSVLSIFSPLSKISQVMTVAQQTSLGAGASVRTFLMNLGAGLKALGNPEAMKGALTLGILTVAVAGSLLLVAFAMNKFGISAKDMILGATAMVIAAGAMVIMSFAIKSLSNAGPKAALAGAIIIGVLLALGVATLAAGVGIGFMAKGFAELFKAIPDIQTFLVVMGGLVLAIPMIAVGMLLLGLSMMATAPLILGGFIMLAAAAAIAYFVMPVLEDFSKSLMTISQAAAGIGPGTGVALMSLAVGITAFMGALMGIAAGGAVAGLGKLFGVKSPLKQAQEIAAAMTALAAPASNLAGSLDKISTVGDIFRPFIEGVLGRKAELQEASKIIADLAEQVATARKSIGEGTIAFPFASAALRAEPVRKPLITEDTARRMREDRNQSQMLESARATNASIKDVVDRLDNNDAMKMLINLLKEWLPKLSAEEKESGGLASAANQWM